jgi:hypothetical protein
LDRVELIHLSLRCFARGLLGLVPVIGFPFAVTAIMDYNRVLWQESAEWNPADRYLVWGVIFAGLGLLITLVLALLVVNAVVQSGTD